MLSKLRPVDAKNLRKPEELLFYAGKMHLSSAYKIEDFIKVTGSWA